MRVFFPLAQHSMLIEVQTLPQEGDRIIITRENLIERAGGVDVGIYGCTVTVLKRLREQGWANESQSYPSFACRIEVT